MSSLIRVEDPGFPILWVLIPIGIAAGVVLLVILVRCTMAYTRPGTVTRNQLSNFINDTLAVGSFVVCMVALLSLFIAGIIVYEGQKDAAIIHEVEKLGYDDVSIDRYDFSAIRDGLLIVGSVEPVAPNTWKVSETETQKLPEGSTDE